MNANALRGSCHCGRVTVVLDTLLTHSTLQPRACDCDFCRKHGAAWISDSAGKLHIDATHADDVKSYRQGSETARFILCAHCGVLVATLLDIENERFGAINAGCLETATTLGDSITVSPQQLTAQEKINRWRSLWTHDVVMTAG